MHPGGHPDHHTIPKIAHLFTTTTTTNTNSHTGAMSNSGTGELPKDAYANAFVPLKPRDGAQVLQTRLHKARIVVEELAEYFAARRELESAYLKALQKISRRNFLSDPAALGPSFVPVYERLIAEIGQVASIHGELEKKIGQECEQAMRGAPNKGEWGRQKEVSLSGRDRPHGF